MRRADVVELFGDIESASRPVVFAGLERLQCLQSIRTAMKRYFAKETPAFLIYVIAGLLGLSGFMAWSGWNSSVIWVGIPCWFAAIFLGWIGFGLVYKTLSWKGVVVDGANVVILRRFAEDSRFTLPKDLVSIDGRATSHRLVIGLKNETQKWRLVLAGLEEPAALLQILDGLIPVVRQKPDGSQVPCKFSEIDTKATDRFLVGLAPKKD
jgi:hypothetical protein